MEFITEIISQLQVEHGVGVAIVAAFVATVRYIVKRTDNKIDDAILAAFEKKDEKKGN